MNLKYYLSKLIKKIHLSSIKNSFVDKTSKICSNSMLINSTIEKFSYVGNNCTVIETYIGKYCSIADGVVIGGASHPISWVSTSPVFNSGKNILSKNFNELDYSPFKKTYIKNDVWIGTNSLIKSGVIIENGAVIAMGSVVTKNVGEYEIWGGNPAKFIKKRFDDKTIKELSRSEWWEYNEDVLVKHASNFNNVEYFIKNQMKDKEYNV